MIRHIKGMTPERQRLLVGAVDVEYTEIEAALASVRDDTELRVARFRVLGDSRKALRHVAWKVREAGGFIRECDPVRTSDEHGAEMMADALEQMANEKRAAGERDGMKGALARWGDLDRMPEGDAIHIWKSKHLTTDEALALMPGWTKGTAYRLLENRGKGAGRPKQK